MLCYNTHLNLIVSVCLMLLFGPLGQFFLTILTCDMAQSFMETVNSLDIRSNLAIISIRQLNHSQQL